MDDKEYYLADSFKDLETVGGIYEKDGKEYLDVVLKSGKVHAARVYRPKKSQSRKPSKVIFNLRKELGFHPLGYVYNITCDDEAELKDFCHFYPGLGAYLKCDEPIEELPWEKGLHIKTTKVYWYEIVDAKDHLFSKEKIYDIITKKRKLYDIMKEKENEL